MPLRAVILIDVGDSEAVLVIAFKIGGNGRVAKNPNGALVGMLVGGPLLAAVLQGGSDVITKPLSKFHARAY